MLGAAYRGGVKETAFSGVFPTVEALRARGAEVRVHDPLYTDDELARASASSRTRSATPSTSRSLQTDHAEYAELAPAELPGVRLLVDGRNTTDAARWVGTPRLVVGGGGVS